MAPAGDVLRRRSCSSTPYKVVERFLKGTMHAARIVGCQDLLPPGPECRRRGAAALRRDLQRPAEMLARVAQANPQSVMAADFIIKRADIFELLRQRRRGFGNAGFEA